MWLYPILTIVVLAVIGIWAVVLFRRHDRRFD